MDMTGQEHYLQAVRYLNQVELERDKARRYATLALVYSHAAMALLSGVVHPGQASDEQVRTWDAFGLALLAPCKVTTTSRI